MNTPISGRDDSLRCHIKNRAVAPHSLTHMKRGTKVVSTNPGERKTRAIGKKFEKVDYGVNTEKEKDGAKRAASFNPTKDIEQKLAITNTRRENRNSGVKTGNAVYKFLRNFVHT